MFEIKESHIQSLLCTKFWCHLRTQQKPPGMADRSVGPIGLTLVMLKVS